METFSHADPSVIQERVSAFWSKYSKRGSGKIGIVDFLATVGQLEAALEGLSARPSPNGKSSPGERSSRDFETMDSRPFREHGLPSSREAVAKPPPELRRHLGQWFRHFDSECNGLEESGLSRALSSTFPEADPFIIRQLVSAIWPSYHTNQAGRIDVREFLSNDGTRETILQELVEPFPLDLQQRQTDRYSNQSQLRPQLDL